MISLDLAVDKANSARGSGQGAEPSVNNKQSTEEEFVDEAPSNYEYEQRDQQQTTRRRATASLMARVAGLVTQLVASKKGEFHSQQLYYIITNNNNTSRAINNFFVVSRPVIHGIGLFVLLLQANTKWTRQVVSCEQ